MYIGSDSYLFRIVDVENSPQDSLRGSLDGDQEPGILHRESDGSLAYVGQLTPAGLPNGKCAVYLPSEVAYGEFEVTK